jgi:hypothetical protein
MDESVKSTGGDQVTFCQVCRHPNHVFPGHMPDCPVYTGEPQRGNPGIPQGLYQDQQQIQGQAGQMSVWPYGPEGPGYTPPYDQSDTNIRILLELAALRAELRELREQITKSK